MRRSSGCRVVFLLLLALIAVCAPVCAQVEILEEPGESIVVKPWEPAAPAASSLRPAAGKFLVARREIRDPNFAKTVVLLLDYGADGALGLVINRPSHVKVSELSSEIEGLETRADPIYLGGPVSAESFFVIFSADNPPEDSDPVFEHVHVTRSAEVLKSLAGDNEMSEFRIFAGYAGWGPGQLDSEMIRGDWHVVEPDEGSLFTGAPDEVWESLVPPEPTRQVRLHVLRQTTPCSAPV